MSTGYAISGRTGIITRVEVPDHPHHELVLARPTPPPPIGIDRYPGPYPVPVAPVRDPALLTPVGLPVAPLYPTPPSRTPRHSRSRVLLVAVFALLGSQFRTGGVL